MFDFLIALFKSWLTKKVDPPAPTPTPPPLPTPSTPEPAQSAETHTAPELHPANYSLDGCTLLTKREAGFVNNPAASTGTLKIILPGKYSGTIARVVLFGEGCADQMKRKEPNEYAAGGGPRQRYYGSLAPASYPKNLYVRWDCNVNGVAHDYAYMIYDPAKREG